MFYKQIGAFSYSVGSHYSRRLFSRKPARVSKYSTIAPRANTDLGPYRPLLTTDQCTILSCVYLYLKICYLIYLSLIHLHGTHGQQHYNPGLQEAYRTHPTLSRRHSTAFLHIGALVSTSH